jgi:hypothetical protein
VTDSDGRVPHKDQERVIISYIYKTNAIPAKWRVLISHFQLHRTERLLATHFSLDSEVPPNGTLLAKYYQVPAGVE